MRDAKNDVPLGSGTGTPGTKGGLKRIGLAVAAILAVSFAVTSAYADCGSMAGMKSTVSAFPALADANAQSAGENGNEANPIPTSGQNHPIVGMWHVIYTAGGSLFAETLKQWHSDGTEFENVDHNPAIGNVCLGVWKEVGIRTVRLHHLGWLFNADGSPGGYFFQDETDTVAENGGSYTGKFTFRTFTQQGEFTGFEVTGTIAALRITVK